MGIDYRISGLIMGSKRDVFYAYIHAESSTQDVPALRTRDGGLKIFYHRRRKHGGSGGTCPHSYFGMGALPPYSQVYS